MDRSIESGAHAHQMCFMHKQSTNTQHIPMAGDHGIKLQMNEE